MMPDPSWKGLKEHVLPLLQPVCVTSCLFRQRDTVRLFHTTLPFPQRRCGHQGEHEKAQKADWEARRPKQIQSWEWFPDTAQWQQVVSGASSFCLESSSRRSKSPTTLAQAAGTSSQHHHVPKFTSPEGQPTWNVTDLGRKKNSVNKSFKCLRH